MEKELEKYRALKAEEYRRAKWSYRDWFCVPEWTKLNSENVTDSRRLRITLFLLKLMFWVFLWCFFIEIEFGTVFFVLSMFYFVYTSMQDGTRKPWEPSAYSVFNDNCEEIDGTLNAEQFERELKFGPGAVSK